MMIRHGVQFHWSNAGYGSFDDFLASMNHDKRKKIKQERRKVREAGITFEWRDGRDISERDWAFFYRCYARTYREHHSTPYLNLEFFQRIGHSMPENLLLVLAYRDGRPIAASFDVHDGTRLYGRYWGAVEHHPVLHFETCYYQVIEYCIARGIQTFRRRRAGRAQDGARAAAGGNALGALDRAARFRVGDREFSREGNARDRALHGRAQRAEAVQRTGNRMTESRRRETYITPAKKPPHLGVRIDHRGAGAEQLRDCSRARRPARRARRPASCHSTTSTPSRHGR